MPSARRIRVSSRALGPRLFVTALIYESLDEMRRAANAYNNTDNPEALGVTQIWLSEKTGGVIVRLVRGYLGTRIVVHEMHHATTAWYGASVGKRVSRSAHLNHYNEPFAHLHSDLTSALVDRLHALGYYDD